MREDRENEAGYVLIEDAASVTRPASRRRRFERTDETVDPWSYQAKRGEGTLRLTTVEYRILRFLAGRPNQALSHSRIAQAVSTDRHRVTAESLGHHMLTLRGQLGFYSDYIQAVPFIGYRFKE